MGEAERASKGTSSRGAGCGCKLPPDFLRGALFDQFGLPLPPEVLVGAENFDDAAVYRLDDERAVVASVDFFTPVVDDARTFGAIAATNALSDLYAMGADPLFALAIAAFPRSEGPERLAEVLTGGAETAAGLGCPVIGGHSIDDPEIKYGLAVIGTVPPDAVMRNGEGRVGDRLILTKPLGTGIAVAAQVRSTLDAAVESMTRANAEAARIAHTHKVRCATDVTGFGLAGHAHEIGEASGCEIQIDAAAVPLLPGVKELAEAGHETGGGRRNLRALGPDLVVHDGNETTRRLLVDPQTSGGLLLAVGTDRAAEVEAELIATGHQARTVGRLLEGPPGRIIAI